MNPQKTCQYSAGLIPLRVMACDSACESKVFLSAACATATPLPSGYADARIDARVEQVDD